MELNDFLKKNNEEFDALMIKKFPNLYKDRYADMQQTCMCWGFDISSGWYNLVYELSEKIEEINNLLPEEKRCYAVQVKNKYGGLRFYVNNTTKEINKLIDEAENKSYTTCEFCGKPGKEINVGWVYTVCDTCKEKLINKEKL